MVEAEDGEGTIPEWQVPGAAAVPYIVYDLSHSISHLAGYLHIILLYVYALMHMCTYR